ncbi:DUF3263 domain-containing protein [Rhodococcus sp. 05-2255-3B1]|uniref:DUF3263 domain-containing protein n=1 Tax=Rhodococcus sp. 05-2255-3B1 TaxID=2022482 RepID=UPI002795E4E1|nr:DUF3263 domain-containing protein [Rhodococcus sp. 05-2255-3B1]
MTPQQAEILQFERRWYSAAGNKEADIREQLGLSAVRYYQLLNAILDRPDALAAEPVLVKRLLRIRSSRQAARRAS